VSDREFDKGEVAAQVQFARDIGTMSVDGAVADKKFGPDLLASFIVRDQFQDAAFGRRE
jgi:hypothetical protein